HVETLVDPIGRQRRQNVGGARSHPLVLASIVICLMEIERRCDGQPKIPEACGDVKGAATGRERLVQFAERRIDRRHPSADLAKPTIVMQLLGNGFGLAEVIEHLSAFTELAQDGPKFEANVESLLEAGSDVRVRLKKLQRLLEPGAGIQERRSRGRL